jgi:hypothetical protein
MFTLLPQDFRKDLLKTYHTRLASVISLFLLTLTALGICLFLPTFIFIKSEHSKLISEESALAESISKKNTDDFSKTLSSLKNDIDLISTPDLNVSPIFKAVESHTLSGIVLQKMSYTTTQPQTFSLSISGVAATRKVLSAFAKELQQEEIFTSVELPISNLAKENLVPFTISIKGAIKPNK